MKNKTYEQSNKIYLVSKGKDGISSCHQSQAKIAVRVDLTLASMD